MRDTTKLDPSSTQITAGSLVFEERNLLINRIEDPTFKNKTIPSVFLKLVEISSSKVEVSSGVRTLNGSLLAAFFLR